MMPISFLGNSLQALREFPDDARQDAGYQLDQVQRGKQPTDFKPMPSVGKGVDELRIWGDSGTYRVIYPAPVEGCCLSASRLSEEDPGHRQAGR
jgi:phage-related protein